MWSLPTAPTVFLALGVSSDVSTLALLNADGTSLPSDEDGWTSLDASVEETAAVTFSDNPSQVVLFWAPVVPDGPDPSDGVPGAAGVATGVTTGPIDELVVTVAATEVTFLRLKPPSPLVTLEV